MEERKSMGSALVDVFDAGMTLVKSEVNHLARRVGEVAKAKGVGVVLLLAAVGPLILALIFLILALFYLLSLWLPAWGAALVIALLSLGATGALVLMGLKKLGSEVQTDEPLVRRTPQEDEPVRADAQTSSYTAHPAGQEKADERWKDTPATPVVVRPSGPAMSGPSVVTVRPGGVATQAAGRPVYESQPDGQPQMYGSGLNEKLSDSGTERVSTAAGSRIVQPRHAGGIPVSTEPTYRDDMDKGGN